MRIVEHSLLLEALRARRARLSAVEKTVSGIIRQVQERGDDALRELTRRYDGVDVTDFRVSPEEVKAARKSFLTPPWRARVGRVADRLRRFAEREQPVGFRLEGPEGVTERRYLPVLSAGLYVPAGTAPLVSTVLMSVVPAQVAGVKRIVVCTPPDRTGRPNQAVVAVAACLGVGEIYRVGGAQAVAALACGTASIPRVRLVAGPGNEYVAAAKRLLYGVVALDCPAGPSEVVVYADGSADPAVVLAELAAQAEHHAGLAVLVTPDRKLTARAQASPVPGYVAVVGGGEAFALISEIAPEHLVLLCRQAGRAARKALNAGAVFIGPHSPVALGDYLAGPSHVLPTGGAAASFAGLSTHTFLRPQALIRWKLAGLRRWAEDLEALARLEGLPAHARSVSVRRGD